MLRCATLVVVFLLLFKESNTQCNLSDIEKFDPQCAEVDIELPSVIFLNQNFVLNIGLTGINVQNISLFNSSDDYCEPISFAEGIQCIVMQTDDAQTTRVNVVCMEDNTDSTITTRQISLIIGITGSINCSIPLSTSLNHTTSISIASIKFLGTHYIIGSGDTVMNVSCQSIPKGSQPVLTYAPFNASEARSYQEYYVESSGTVVADFQDGIYSGILSCSSIDGYTSLAYITLFEDLPIAYYPSGNNVTVVVGASLDITVVLLANEDTDELKFSAVEGNDRNNPKITSIDGPWGINYQIEYTQVGVPPTSKHQLCFSYDGSGSGGGYNASKICTDSFNLYVEEPSIEISTTISANLYSDFANEKVNISCVPSDLTTIVFWQSANSTPLWDVYPDFVFSPQGLNHTVTLTSAPNGIEIFYCGLYNYEDTLLNERNVTVVSLTTPVSIWNGNNEVLNDSIINLFTVNEDNEPILSLRCFGALENGLLYWRSSNVTALPDILSFDDQIKYLQLTTEDRDVTLQYSISSSHRIGYYMCQSNVTENTVTVFVTLDNPYWELISESSILPPIGTNESIGIRFAYNSRGYGNSGSDIAIDLTLEPQSNSLIDGLMTDPNQYYYYYTFTASISDRGSFVFQAQQSNNSFTTVVDVYSTVPEFTSVTTPVYGRLSRMVTLSCTTNDTVTPIIWGIWNYEEYVPINDEPGFSFQPPVINEDVSFQISTATLGNDMNNYFYDVDSGSYSQIQFACGFMNGNNEGLYGASNVILNIREYDIQVENGFGHNTIKNNSIVNSFNVLDSKRNIELSDTFRSRCIVTQGNHDALWKVELFEDNTIAPSVIINNTYNDYLQATTNNPYESELTAFVNDNTTGRYTCESAITGIYNTFILTNENPFVRAKSEIQVNQFLGETVFITFWAAETSDGDFNRLSELDVIFTDTTNNIATLEAVQNCNYEEASGCYEYELEIIATPSSAGLYRGLISDCYPLENGTEVCSYARDTVNVTVEVPDLVPSNIEHKVYVGQSLSLSCEPSKGNFVIQWEHNGVVIPGFIPQPPSKKRNALLSILSPYPYNYNLFLSFTSIHDAGVYSCSMISNDEIIVTQTINVTVSEIPAVESSTELAAHMVEDFNEGVVQVTCLPNDTSAVIAWQLLDGTPLLEAYPNAILTPTNLNHTVTFMSPPLGIEIVICGLYNNGDDLLNIQRITVAALSRPVSIWNNNRELVPNAVVNVFSNFIEDNLPILSLRCLSTEGNGMLYWKTRNVSLLPTYLNSNSQINNLTIIEFEHDITINYAQLSNQKTGYYACVSNTTDEEFEALVTLDNPYWNLISSSTLLPPLGTNESIIIQYAYNSEGYGNTGTDLAISLEFTPQYSEPELRFQNKLSNPNQYLYYYNFTAGIGDRGLLVFQANTGGEIVLSSSVDTYSIAPFFTSVSNPVYGRLGGAVSLSCTANETTAPIVWGIWNYEEYFPLSDEPGFSFIPSVINEEISFAITSDTLDKGKDYSYDVDSGSYSTIRFGCGFKDGNNDGLFQPSSVFLLIRQYDISLSSNGVDTVQNNSIVNDFDDNYDYYGERKRIAEYPPNSYQLLCTTVQGNHNPIWTAEFFATPNVSVTIDNSFSELLYSDQQNQYVSELIVDVYGDLSGRYTCRSSISGVLVRVILTSENPFVRAKSGSTISGTVGEEITLTFYAALNSVGDYNDDITGGLEVVHTALDGTNTTLTIARSCDNADEACYKYAFTLKELLPSHAGTYTASVEKCEFNDDETEVCTRAFDTIHLIANVPQLLPSHIDNAEFYINEQLELHCVPAFGDYEIAWLYNNVPITEFLCNPRNNNEMESPKETCLSPEPYHTNLLIQPASNDDSGVYTCNLVVADQVITSATINVTVTERPPLYECFADNRCFESQSVITESISDCCSDGGSYMISDADLCVPCPTIQCPLEYNAGFLWMAREAGSVATLSCAEAGDQFSPFTDITRKCMLSGEWDGVDLTNCSVLSDAKSFASVSIVLADNEIIDAIDNQNELQDTMEELLDSYNLTYSSLTVKTFIEETGTLDFEIEFDVFSDEEISVLSEVQSSLFASASFGRFATEESQSQLYVLKVASSCPCNVNMTASMGIEVITKCSTASITNPCECVNDKCECQSPFVGDGTLCTIDSDGDMYPDEPLETCGDNDTPKYCTKDNCVMVYNPEQNPELCIVIAGFTGCSYVTDLTWGIEWANTDSGEMNSKPCPPGSRGTATRLCSLNGTWNEPNVIKCLPEVYQNLLDQSYAILSSTDGDVRTRVSQAVVLTQDLAEATSQTLGNTESILPAAINATNEILLRVFSLLFDTLDNDTDVSNETAGLRIAEVINNLLEDNQISGWSDLQTEGEDILGSDILLLNIENYGLYLSLTRNESVIRLGNIAINAKQYRVQGDQGSLLFPQPGDLDDTDFPSQAASVAIPVEILGQRAKDNGVVPVVSTLCRNMERFLEFVDTANENFQPAALVWSGQVTSLERNVSKPINLTFRVFTNNSDNLYQCVFWNGSESRWSSAGVATVGNRIDEYGYSVVDCQSNHLTPFSVLVDVSGAIQNANPGEYRALQIVSYIGCAVSLACLAVTIVFFLTYGKRLFTSVHFFIHLNLAIALFCGYFIFAVGVETARGNQGGCGFVAALLQYFFLASFCWMLCEGLMLYLMLVVVFSTLSKRWYVFLAIGWAPPLIPVVIGLAAGYRHYGVQDDQGELQFCWLSTTRGVIWAFVGPMIVIILINVVFLIMALRSVWRTTKSKKYKANDKTRGIVMSLLKATLILLPLLGLTWVFGLLTVDQNSSVFAWIFTLLNTAQGVAIFIFHVVRSDRVWPKISPYLERLIPKALKSKKSEISSQGSSSTTTLKYGNSTLKYRFRNAGAGYQMSTITKNKNFDMISEEPDLESAIVESEEKSEPPVNESSDIEQRMKLKEAEAKLSESSNPDDLPVITED